MKNPTLTLMAIALGDLLAAIDTTGVNVAVPQIAHTLHIPATIAQWVPNAFSLAMVSLLIVAGKFGDRYGHRKLFLWGMAIFGLASLGCGIAVNFSQLATLRFVQGIGGAILYTCGWALIAHLWEDREKAFAVTAGFFAVGVVIGPPLAGWLTGISVGGFAGWHLVFLINVPIIMLAFVLAARFTPAISRDASARVGLLSAILLILGLALLVQTLSHPKQYWVMVVALIILLCFVLSERYSRTRLIDRVLFRNRTFNASNATSLLLMAVVTGFSFVATFFLQDTLKFSSLTTGLCMLPVPGAMVIFAGLGSQIREWRNGALLSSGLAVCALGWLLVRGGGSSYWDSLFWAFCLLGASGGLLMTSVVSAVMGSAPAIKAGTASGLLNTLQQLGALVGVAAIAGMVANLSLATSILLLFAIGAMVGAFLMRKRDLSIDSGCEEGKYLSVSPP